MVKRKPKQRYILGGRRAGIRLNRKHTDVLFRRLFRDKKDLLELYNALNGSAYENPDELDVVTMEDVIFMKMKNDLSFIIGNSLNLYEHQSTWNPNMPLRGLLYFAQQFEGLVSVREDDLYGRGKIILPTPVYIVFYNGSNMAGDSVLLYLSDSFSAGRGSGCLECTCKVLNITRGHNRTLMDKCHRLWEYSEFTSQIEDNRNMGMDREEAILTAIDNCISSNILTDILKNEKSEVYHMLLTEYDEKKHLKHTFEEGRQEGISIGRQEGILAGRQDKLREMVQKKLAKGKTLAQIADELEEDPSDIEKFCHQESPL